MSGKDTKFPVQKLSTLEIISKKHHGGGNPRVNKYVQLSGATSLMPGLRTW